MIDVKPVAILQLVLVSILSVVSHAQDRVPPGYYLGARASLPDSLIESRANGQFRIEIIRIATDSSSRRALEIAESVFPESKEIERVASRETLPIVQARLKRAAALPGDRWWWDDFDGVLTPYAITGLGVDYYLSRIRARSDSINPFNAGQAHRGTLRYHATVAAAPEADDASGGHVVKLKLDWFYSCGRLCAVGFSVAREVVLSKDGRVIQVRGDGRPAVTVS
jgi:hypothetical protein